MIVDPAGNRIGGDGPTGRQIVVVEVVKDGKATWAFQVGGGGFEHMEIIQVLTQVVHGVATKFRGEMHHMETMAREEARLEKEKSDGLSTKG